MKYKNGEEVKIINGILKGLSGTIVKIEITKIKHLAYIKINDDNIIKVNINDIESIYEEYLIYKTDGNNNIICIFNIQRLDKSKVETYLKEIHEKFGCLSYEYLYATPLDSVEFQFKNKTLNFEQIEKIIKSR